MSPAQFILTPWKSTLSPPGVIHFVHHPEAAAVDRALVDFELARQLLRIDLLVVVRTDWQGRRRIDVCPLRLADADEGAESAERGTAGIVGVDSTSGTWFELHVLSFVGGYTSIRNLRHGLRSGCAFPDTDFTFLDKQFAIDALFA